MFAYDAGLISLYLRSILWDLGPQDAATIPYEDNDGATAIANAGKPMPRTRHIDVKFYAIQEWVERDLLVLRRIDTSINTADHLTKPLPCILFYRHRDFYMGHVPPTYSPKYNDIVRVYLSSHPSNPLTPTPNSITAKATRSSAPWNIVLQSLYLMPLAGFRSNSEDPSEHGGVTDTYDSCTVVSLLQETSLCIVVTLYLIYSLFYLL
ncbi:hypothetical protein ACHAW6_002026 [Cyclotella cf. meneghiniana]